MVEFYGFHILNDSPRIEPSRAFPAAAANWLTPGNHNYLRITRILRSSRLLGLAPYSAAFFRALSDIYQTPAAQRAIGPVSFSYWQEAAHSELDESVDT